MARCRVPCRPFILPSGQVPRPENCRAGSSGEEILTDDGGSFTQPWTIISGRRSSGRVAVAFHEHFSIGCAGVAKPAFFDEPGGEAVGRRLGEVEVCPQVADGDERLMGEEGFEGGVGRMVIGVGKGGVAIGAVFERDALERFHEKGVGTEVHGADTRVAQPAPLK